MVLVGQIGLLDAGDGRLRQKFTELGVIQFEDWTDTTEEYSVLDAVAADRCRDHGFTDVHVEDNQSGKRRTLSVVAVNP